MEAALAGVPVGPPVDPAPAPGVVPVVRNLNRSRLGFSREVIVEAPLNANGGVQFLNVEALRLAQPHIQDLLNNQLRFLVKVIARVRLAETVIDPETEMESERYSEVWVPLAPWPVPPLARTDERFRRYILREVDSRLNFALQESNYTEDSRKRVVGVRSLMLLIGPAALAGNIPAPAGLPAPGGCHQDLPAHIYRHGVWNPKNLDHKCFELCVRAHVAGVGDYSCYDRKQAAKALGAPFFDEPPPSGPGARARDARKMVDMGLDFSMLPEGPVAFEHIDIFEAGNPGKVGVFVYEPLSAEWATAGSSTVRPLREPSVAKPYEHEIVLLLYRMHYSLVYDFSKVSSLRSKNLPVEMQRGTTHWHTCPRCQSNMKTEMALRTHLRKGLCDASPEQRASIPNIRLPESAEEAKLHYKPGPSEEWCELVIYADLEVFHDAPAEGQVGKTIAKQHEAASTCYLAKARGGYEVPKKHRIHLDRCRLQDGPFDVLERFLRSLLELAEDHLRWCRDVNVAPTFKPGEEEAFHAAQNCQCCGAAFGQETMKVLHHRHGTGEYLAALCSPCNVAVRRRKLIPIFFHNGGGYDFHFLVRAIAHLKQEQPVEPESSDSEELSLDELEYLADLQLEDCEVCEQLVDWKELKFEVLVKSGERYLQVRLGPLLFLDSCNIFPTSLEALISDLRGTEENPAQAFSLLAERHPVFAAAELCEDRNRREQVWSKLLKKIPMPFEKLTGPECWDLPALMPDKSYYNSRLSGEICSDAKYKEIAEIVDFFGFKSFAEFHDVYLYTDMALADVAEAYREAFYENYSLDPVFYVTGASASWDAMLKKCVGKEQPLGLIQNREIFEITRASIRGGLCNPFQPHARANNPRLGELYNAEEATSYINKFDVNSQYPSVMSKPLPADGGNVVKLADSKKGRLKQLNELLEVTDYASNEYATSHLVKVSYYVGFRAHDRVDWAPPARMSISTGELSEYSKQLMRQRGWEKSPGNPKLMPFLGMHKEEALQLRLLKFYMETMEVRVCEVHAIITFQCRAFMRPFIEECYARRLALKSAGRKLQDKVVKTTMCVQFGKSVQNQEAFKNAQVFVDRRLYERKMGGSRVTDFHAYPSSAGFLGVIYSKRARGSLLKSVPQIGAFVLDEARLDIMKYHYSLRKIFDGGLGKPVDPAYSLADRSKVRAVYSDTDSDIVHIYSEEDPAVKLAHNNLVGDSPCFWDVGGDVKRTEEYLVGLGASPEAAKLAAKRRGELGGFGDEGAPLAIAEVVALAPKCYSEYLTDSTEFFHKFKVKGLSKQQRKKLTHEDYRKVWLSGRPGVVEPTYRFQSQNHVVGLVRIERIGITPFTDKVHQLDAYNSRPHGHWRNLPEPIPSLCRLAFGLEGSRRLPECFVDLVLSYLLPGGGYLARELRGERRVGVIRGLGVTAPSSA